MFSCLSLSLSLPLSCSTALTDLTAVVVNPSDWEGIHVFLAETAAPRPGGASGAASTGAEGGEGGAVVPMWTGRSEAAEAVFGKVVVIERLGKRALRKVVRA